MKILLCTVPDGPLAGTLDRYHPDVVPQKPVGILRLMDWMVKKGFDNIDSDIYDINNLRPTDEELIENFKKINPTIVGLSATLSHCYPNVKRITKILRKLFPNIWLVVGGHITASSNVLLKKTETDICVVGDGEIPWVKLLEYFKLNPTHHELNYKSLCEIKGLAFMDKNNQLKVTGNADQIAASELKFTDYGKLKKSLKENGDLIKDLFTPIKGHSLIQGSKFYEKNINKMIAQVETAKGCVARCTFCQRASKGYKSYSLKDLEAHLLELKEKYNVAGISTGYDENFGSDKKQSYEFAKIVKKLDLFWVAGAVRCTSVTYEDLKFYKEHNLVAMKFGIESGSQEILDVMEKKFTTQDVFDAINNCRKVGVKSQPDALMLGMPGETAKTVEESAAFIASLRYALDLDWNIGGPFWAMAIPGTPLYEYCQQIGVIGKTLDEEEEYLIRTAEQKTNFLNYVNKTTEDIKEVYYWNYLFDFAGKRAFIDLVKKSNKSVKAKISEIYKKCIKGEIKDFTDNLSYLYRGTHHFRKGRTLKQIFKWATLLIANFVLGIICILLPRIIFYPILKIYSNLRFRVLKQKYEVKDGKQKYNIFVKQNTSEVSDLTVTEKRITKSDRQIERSLRHFVMLNRRQLKPAITDEEKGLELLAQGQ